MNIRAKASGHSCLAMCSAPISQAANFNESYPLLVTKIIGKSTLIKMKAGNLLWDEKGGIKAIRWYSNKNIMNPQMSDRDRHSACIGINMFEFDERRGQRAIEN